MNSWSFASGAPCDWSLTVSWSGQRVAAIRRRRSTRSASGMSMRNGRIASSGAAADGNGNRLAVPTAAMASAVVAKSLRRSWSISLLVVSIRLSESRSVLWKACGGVRATRTPCLIASGSLAQRPERAAHLGTEKLWLFPGGEMSAFGELVEVNQLGIRFLRPTARSRVDLVGKDAHGDRD